MLGVLSVGFIRLMCRVPSRRVPQARNAEPSSGMTECGADTPGKRTTYQVSANLTTELTLPVVSYACETLSLTLREEKRGFDNSAEGNT